MNVVNVNINGDAKHGTSNIKQLAHNERTHLYVIMLLLALLYGLLPIYLDGPRMLSRPDLFGGFWSPDSGARFAMIRNWNQYGSLVHLHYSYSNVDPTGQLHPLAYFLFHHEHDFVAMYPTLFPLLSGLAYRTFGFYGLTLVPMLCGLGCLLVTYATARRLNLRYRLLLVLAIGVATPLVIYSAVFWDHSALMLISALAGYWMLRAVQDASLRSAVAVGVIIGSGMWLHEQFLAMIVAVWLAALPLTSRHRTILIGTPIGFLVVFLFWGLFNWHVYGTFAGSHLGANVIQNGSDHRFNIAAILDVNDFLDRAMSQLVGTMFPTSPGAEHPELWPYFLCLVCLLIVYVFWTWEAHSNLKLAVASALSSAAGSICIFLLLKLTAIAAPTQLFQGNPLLTGLFLATPLLIPALAVPWYVRPRKPHAANEDVSNNIFYAWASRACSLFILFSLINPMRPGVDWGSRYLLTSLPLLSILAAFALENQIQSLQGEWRGAVKVGTAILVCTSFVCQVNGLLWIHRMLAYDQTLNTQVRSLLPTVLVTNADFNARLFPNPEEQARFLVRTNDDGTLFAKILNQRDIRNFTFVGLEGGEKAIADALSRSRIHFKVGKKHRLSDVDQEGEIGDELQVVRFVLGPKRTTQNYPSIPQSTSRPLLLHRYSFSESSNHIDTNSEPFMLNTNNHILVGGAAVGKSAIAGQFY